MRVLILSDTESSHGGAIATTRLALGLVAKGIEVHRAYAECNSRRPQWKSHPFLSYQSPAGDFVKSLIGLFPEAQRGPLSQALCNFKLKKLISRIRPDVINIHTIFATGWDMSILEAIPPTIPACWTLHEMWSMTGACNYAYRCDKFVTGCDATCATEKLCAGVDKDVAPCEIAEHWSRKQRFITQRPALTAITPSQWLKKEALRGMWRNHEVAHIPYGLNLSVFSPIDRKSAQEALGLECKGPVALLPATTLADERKGARFALSALEKVSVDGMTLLTMGHQAPNVNISGIKVHHMGFVKDERLQAILYSAADLMLHPALEDNLPNTVLEALACGTPVAAFNTGGLPDMITDGVTGWLEADISEIGFTQCLSRALKDINSGVDCRSECRSKAERDYPLTLQAERYLKLFKQLHNKSTGS